MPDPGPDQGRGRVRLSGFALFLFFAAAVAVAVWTLRPATDLALYEANRVQLIKTGQQLQQLDGRLLAFDTADTELKRLNAIPAPVRRRIAADLITGQLATAWQLEALKVSDRVALSFETGDRTSLAATNAFYANALIRGLIRQQQTTALHLSAVTGPGFGAGVGRGEGGGGTGNGVADQAGKKQVEKKREQVLLKLKQQQTEKLLLLPAVRSAIKTAHAAGRPMVPEASGTPGLPKVPKTPLLSEIPLSPKVAEEADRFGLQDDLSGLDLRPDELTVSLSGHFMTRFPVRLRSIRQPVAGKRYTNSDKVLVIRTVGNATVVAPFDGLVKFAGEFGNFGPTLILEHQPSAEFETTHSVLYGMRFLSVEANTPVVKGEPLGRMAPKKAKRKKVAEKTGAGEKDGEMRLYYELQFDGKKTDPLHWLE